MMLHRARTGQKTSLISPATIVTLALLCLPVVVVAAAGQTPDTADLMTQAADTDFSNPAVDPATATEQVAATETSSEGFSTEELEQMIAPIALYPDALLMQILMASTYPLEIVEADRWVRANPELKDDALNEALKEQDWDPSVKSLAVLPTVLKQMSENLDWTQDLGDAFLAQQNDLMDTAQRMRGLAYDAGNLESTEQQTVSQQEDKIIVIESTSPEIIYVPTYSSTVVYGPGWGYPYWRYPYWYYPPRVGYGMVAFGAGVIVGGAIWGSARWGWGRNSVNINVNRHNEFNRNTSINGGRDRVNAQGGRGQGGTSAWQHDSSHRKGVNYGNSNVAQKYGGNSATNRVTNNQARGRSSTTAANRASSAPKASNRSASARNTSPTASNRSQSSRNSAYSGSRSPSTNRASSYRGASSRGNRSYGGSRGGMSRGGGRRR